MITESTKFTLDVHKVHIRSRYISYSKQYTHICTPMHNKEKASVTIQLFPRQFSCRGGSHLPASLPSCSNRHMHGSKFVSHIRTCVVGIQPYHLASLNAANGLTHIGLHAIQCKYQVAANVNLKSMELLIGIGGCSYTSSLQLVNH